MKYIIIITLIFILLASSAFTVEGLIDGINQVRLDNGLEQVQRFDVLDRFAQHRLYENKGLSHDNLKYDVQRMWQFGLVCNYVDSLGEIIARTDGEFSDDYVIQAWLNSPTHRAVILDPAFRYIGGYTENNIVIINFMGGWK